MVTIFSRNEHALQHPDLPANDAFTPPPTTSAVGYGYFLKIAKFVALLSCSARGALLLDCAVHGQGSVEIYASARFLILGTGTGFSAQAYLQNISSSTPPSASQVLYVIRAPWFYGDASKAYWSSEPQGPSQNTLSIFAGNAWGRRAEPNRIKHMIDAWGFAALAHELCHVAWHRRTSWGNGYLNALTLMAAAAAGTGMNETLSLSKFINEYALARAQSYGILAKKQQLATDRLFWRLLLGCGAANKLIEGLTETEVTLLFAPPCTEAAIQSRLNFANLHAIAVTVAGTLDQSHVVDAEEASTLAAKVVDDVGELLGQMIEEMYVTSGPSEFAFTENWIRAAYGIGQRVGHYSIATRKWVVRGYMKETDCSDGMSGGGSSQISRTRPTSMADFPK